MAETELFIFDIKSKKFAEGRGWSVVFQSARSEMKNERKETGKLQQTAVNKWEIAAKGAVQSVR